ncbi:MAG: hypothetical protein H0V44_14450, partial [Planctomycetes bacterium]|nr:hypothetical protein [Planctomycetota bacterium]
MNSPMLPGLCASALLLTACGLTTVSEAAVTVVVDKTVRHQTIRGYRANPMDSHVTENSPTWAWQRNRALDEIITMGTTGCRVSVNRREWEDVVNDNADPYTANPAAFVSTKADRLAVEWLKPLEQR